jgi:hypothetical protein
MSVIAITADMNSFAVKIVAGEWPHRRQYKKIASKRVQCEACQAINNNVPINQHANFCAVCLCNHISKHHVLHTYVAMKNIVFVLNPISNVKTHVIAPNETTIDTKPKKISQKRFNEIEEFVRTHSEGIKSGAVEFVKAEMGRLQDKINNNDRTINYNIRQGLVHSYSKHANTDEQDACNFLNGKITRWKKEIETYNKAAQQSDDLNHETETSTTPTQQVYTPDGMKDSPKTINKIK